jgi:DNA polymerase elongation subunit (family B)
VYFSVAESWSEEDERSVVADVARLLPPLVQLEFEGRYRAMLSHEPKNYALLGHDGRLLLKGVAFRSSRAEPFGVAFLKRAITLLLVGDLSGVRDAWVETVLALRNRDIPTREVTSRVRLTKSPERYRLQREQRREAMYEALLTRGRSGWRAGDKVRVYRASQGWRLHIEDEDARDYDVEHYVRALRDNYASRLFRALRPGDAAALFGDPDQYALFEPDFQAMRTILVIIPRAG